MTTAVVASANRGINRAIARRLAEAGHTVILTDIDEPAVKGTAAEIRTKRTRIAPDDRNIASPRKPRPEVPRATRPGRKIP